jgi:holliday junction DNA helicase RuvA
VIASLSGTLLEKSVQRLIIDVGGVGYDVQVPLSTFYAAGEPGGRITLRIHTHVREDAIQLFGFVTVLELELFLKLIGVNGIGPKVGLAILSGIESAELVRAIRQSDLARLTKIPGVGRKTAERLILELKDRLPQTADSDLTRMTAPSDDLRDDLLSALGNLGYQAASAERAIDKALAGVSDRAFEPVLRSALKILAGG